jgi:hypothetical protein
MSSASIFFTFRPQICEQQLFEDFLKLFIPFLQDHKHTAYSIENDGTLGQHIHAVIHGYKDKDKFFQKWNKSNGLKDFKAACKKYKNTDPNGFDTQKIPEEKTEYLHVLGYTLKEAIDGRSWSNIPAETVTEGLEYYHAHRRIKAKETTNKDWTLLTPKNAYAHIESFVEKHKIDLPDHLLSVKMTQDRYGFANLSSKQARLIQAEIALARNHEANTTASPEDQRKVMEHGQDLIIDGHLPQDYIHEYQVLYEDHNQLIVDYKSLQRENEKLKKLLEAR